MNKKVNTLLFVLGATLMNIIMFSIIGLGLLGLLWLVLRISGGELSPEVTQWALVLIFIMTVALSFICYNAIIKVFVKKVDMDKYFDPIVKPRRR